MPPPLGAGGRSPRWGFGTSPGPASHRQEPGTRAWPRAGAVPAAFLPFYTLYLYILNQFLLFIVVHLGYGFNPASQPCRTLEGSCLALYFHLVVTSVKTLASFFLLSFLGGSLSRQAAKKSSSVRGCFGEAEPAAFCVLRLLPLPAQRQPLLLPR